MQCHCQNFDVFDAAIYRKTTRAPIRLAWKAPLITACQPKISGIHWETTETYPYCKTLTFLSTNAHAMSFKRARVNSPSTLTCSLVRPIWIMKENRSILSRSDDMIVLVNQAKGSPISTQFYQQVAHTAPFFARSVLLPQWFSLITWFCRKSDLEKHPLKLFYLNSYDKSVKVTWIHLFYLAK